MEDDKDLGPNVRLLDRHLQRAENRDFLEHVDRLMLEAVDRSTQVFARCWSTTPDTLAGQVPLMLFRHVLEMVDGVHVLLLESASVPSRVQLRSAFEALIYLEYLLRDDPHLRTQAYVAGSYLWGLRYSRRLLKGSGERKTFFRELGARVPSDPAFGRMFCTTREDVQRYEDFLDSPEVKPGYDLFLAFKREKRRWPSAWYQALDFELRSFKDLCVHLDRGGEYVHYDLWSRSVHPDLLAVHSITPPDGQPQRIRKLRDGDRISDGIETAIAFLRDGCAYALGHARPDEVASFLQGWQRDIEPLLAEFGGEETVWEAPHAGG